MKVQITANSTLHKKAKRGFRGYPVATVAFYGPTGTQATKIAVGIVNGSRGEVDEMKRWIKETGDIRQNADVLAEMLEFIESRNVKSVLMTDGLLGCPHEEGIDYPDDTSCPNCPYWAGRDRFTKQRSH